MITSKHGTFKSGPTTCRDCPASIVWVMTFETPGKPSRPMPVNVSDDTSHFSNCPAANARRRTRARAAAAPAPVPPPEGVGPILTGRVLRFCLNEGGRVVLAGAQDEATALMLSEHVVVIALEHGAKMAEGDRVKLRKLPPR